MRRIEGVHHREDLLREGVVEQEQPIYTPSEGEAQFSWRAIAAGSLLGGLIACMNIYMGLKIGWSYGGSIIAAIAGFGIFSLAKKSLSVLELNITQTAASGAGSMASAAGLLSSIPALQLLGVEVPVYGLFLWAISIAFLGVFFSVPLRRQMLFVEKLRFPTGTATAETILAMTSKDSTISLQKARLLLYISFGVGTYTLLSYFIPALESPSWPSFVQWSIFSVMAAWGFKIYVSPMLIGAGILVQPRVGLSLALGAILGWGVLGPTLQWLGWTTGRLGDLQTGVRGWLLWSGVALMISEAFVSLLLSWELFVQAFRGFRREKREGNGDFSEKEEFSSIRVSEVIPFSWWVFGLVLASFSTLWAAWYLFGIQPWLSFLAIVVAALLSVVAMRATGETDLNPAGTMSKVTQFLYGGLAPHQISVNLMAAGITSAGASQSADMMQDLKTGWLLNASPKKQFLAQLIGIVAGVIFCVPIYLLFIKAYPLGGPQIPAPAAKSWTAVAKFLTQGRSALPPHAFQGVLIFAAIGALLALLRRFSSFAPYVPSGLAMGIAFIIPAYYSLAFLWGTLFLLIWRRLRPQQSQQFSFIVASGLIAGEGLLSIVKAIFTILHIPRWF